MKIPERLNRVNEDDNRHCGCFYEYDCSCHEKIMTMPEHSFFTMTELYVTVIQVISEDGKFYAHVYNEPVPSMLHKSVLTSDPESHKVALCGKARLPEWPYVALCVIADEYGERYQALTHGVYMNAGDQVSFETMKKTILSLPKCTECEELSVMAEIAVAGL